MLNKCMIKINTMTNCSYFNFHKNILLETTKTAPRSLTNRQSQAHKQKHYKMNPKYFSIHYKKIQIIIQLKNLFYSLQQKKIILIRKENHHIVLSISFKEYKLIINIIIMKTILEFKLIKTIKIVTITKF